MQDDITRYFSYRYLARISIGINQTPSCVAQRGLSKGVYSNGISDIGKYIVNVIRLTYPMYVVSGASAGKQKITTRGARTFIHQHMARRSTGSIGLRLMRFGFTLQRSVQWIKLGEKETTRETKKYVRLFRPHSNPISSHTIDLCVLSPMWPNSSYLLPNRPMVGSGWIEF